MKRALVLVLDSVGVGAASDSAAYGDVGSDTLGHIAQTFREKGLPFALPNLSRWGLAHLKPEILLPGQLPPETPVAHYGILEPSSKGKDTTTGHWEMMGVVLETPFPTYPDGFPPEILTALERATGVEYIGNKPASGTAIIEELGERHMRERAPILYTSADSVLQIAAHEAVFPIEQLYDICTKAREIADTYRIGRVIARPFEGEVGSFSRTSRRHDYSMNPPNMVLNALSEKIPVEGVGKIFDIFNGSGIQRTTPTTGNAHGMDVTLERWAALESGLLFVNLVDFDMLYGHRNNWRGYGEALMAFDQLLPQIEALTTEEDMVLVTADHGNDPTFPGTDHCRENVPLLAYQKGQRGLNLGNRSTFADLGATLCHYFDAPWEGPGTPFL